MNTFRKILLTTILVLSAPRVFAGGKVGNGGDVRVCRGSDQKITEIELFDLYEARTKRKNLHLDIALGDDNVSVSEKVHMALNRLGRYMPHFASELQTRADQILSPQSSIAVFMDGIRLENIPDIDTRYWPSNCQVEQIAVHQKPAIPSDPEFLFNNDLFKAFEGHPGGRDQQAALILHEVLYERLALMGQQDSTRVRYLNSFLVSSRFDRPVTPQTDYENWEILSQLPISKTPSWLLDVNQSFVFKIFGLNFISVNDVRFTEKHFFFGKVYFEPSNTGKIPDQFVHVQGKDYSVATGKLNSEHWSEDRREWLTSCEGSDISFYPSGAVQFFTPRYASRFKVGDQEIETTSTVTFYEDGSVKQITPSSKDTVIRVRTDALHFRGELSFFSDGSIESGLLSFPQEIVILGQKLVLQGYTAELAQVHSEGRFLNVRFYKTGMLNSGILATSGYVWSRTDKKWLCITSNGVLLDGRGTVREYTWIILQDDGSLKTAQFQPFSGPSTTWRAVTEHSLGE